jgi:hypothetical protein
MQEDSLYCTSPKLVRILYVGVYIHPSSCSHLPGGIFWGPRYTKIGKPRGNGMPYKLATKRIMNGLPSKSFSIMVLPFG